MDAKISREQLKIIDANANRAREGIRTTEDYIRLALLHSRWSPLLKTIRHAITDELSELQSSLLQSRNVSSDPGRPVSEPQSEAGESARSIAVRGIKRAQEALRVLEENLRSVNPSTSLRLSSHRFTLYEAEQWLVCSSEAARTMESAFLYVLLTESLCRQGLMETAEAVLKGGAKLVQLREKSAPDSEFLAQARQLRQLCEKFGAVLFCNDRVDLALGSGACGVHLGQNDLPPGEARTICGERLLVGRSTHSLEQAVKAVKQEHADYIAIGSMYDTKTKPERILAGLDLATQVCSLKLNAPIFAIGGITLERIPELKAVGIKRVAVSSAIIMDRDPERATARMMEELAG